MSIIKTITTKVISNYNGYHVRWYKDGWHHWYFRTGGESFTTSGEQYLTNGFNSLNLGDNPSASEMLAIRGILQAKYIELLTDDGWKPATLNDESWQIGRADRNGQPVTFSITSWLKGSSISPIVPPIETEVTVTASASEITDPEGSTTITLGQAITSLVSSDIIVYVDSIALVNGTHYTLTGVTTTSIVVTFTAGADLTGDSVIEVSITKYPFIINSGNPIAVPNGIVTLVRATNGLIYNWYAASDANLLNTDWKVAENSDLTTLVTTLGGYSVAGGKMKEIGFTHWDNPNTGADNSSNYTLIGCGLRYNTGFFATLKTQGYLWTKNEYSATKGWYGNARYNYASFLHATVAYVEKQYGMGVRGIYVGAGVPSSTITDYDGNVYDVIQIGSQYWLKQNWACTHLNDGTVIPEVTDNSAWAALTTKGLCAYNNDWNNVFI